ncbi:Abi-alpha family protein [Saccharopolyspora mangrovi]|uniref:Abi-alpha family protein n=1 Tax=Saccharopolyspora mangrovi TaxID=3082379 RepID=A0ABU6ACJ9_9PSEU|nr:Abi-alpha family protein [Saccharopolyspora sp. S2-29]MEB3369183.1 Abi-alpha family protein [Saccharopolyspora sp. S2-29]
MTGEIELSRRAEEHHEDEESAGSNVLGGLLGLAGRVGRDVARTGMGLVRELPGGVEVERQVQAIEKVVASGVRVWLDSVDERESAEEDLAEPAQPEDDEAEPVQDGLREAMSELLFRSATAGKAEAREYLYAGILRLITPDEARILAGLGDGVAYPVVHVAERSGIGGTSRFVLRNGSTVGRAVGVALHDEVPHYLTRLQALGLVEIGAELDAMDDQYEILQTESRIREALRSAKSTKVIRRSVRMSELGARFWRRCDPTLISGAEDALKA